jgi:hypothetical protein
MVGGGREDAALVPIAGGMVVLGGVNNQDLGSYEKSMELFDQGSGRWLSLPHVILSKQAVAVSLPVTVLFNVSPTA